GEPGLAVGVVDPLRVELGHQVLLEADFADPLDVARPGAVAGAVQGVEDQGVVGRRDRIGGGGRPGARRETEDRGEKRRGEDRMCTHHRLLLSPSSKGRGKVTTKRREGFAGIGGNPYRRSRSSGSIVRSLTTSPV